MYIVVPRSKNHWENYLPLPFQLLCYTISKPTSGSNKAMKQNSKHDTAQSMVELGGYVDNAYIQPSEITPQTVGFANIRM